MNKKLTREVKGVKIYSRPKLRIEFWAMLRENWNCFLVERKKFLRMLGYIDFFMHVFKLNYCWLIFFSWLRIRIWTRLLHSLILKHSKYYWEFFKLVLYLNHCNARKKKNCSKQLYKNVFFSKKIGWCSQWIGQFFIKVIGLDKINDLIFWKGYGKILSYLYIHTNFQ